MWEVEVSDMENGLGWRYCLMPCDLPLDCRSAAPNMVVVRDDDYLSLRDLE